MTDYLTQKPCWKAVAVCIASVGIYMFCAISIIHGCHVDIPIEEEPPIVYQDQWTPDWEGVSIKLDQEAEAYLNSVRI